MQAGGVEPKWLSDTADKLYFNRTSRDMKRVDVCVADAATGEVKTLIEERLNTYVEYKPLFSDQTTGRNGALVGA